MILFDVFPHHCSNSFLIVLFDHVGIIFSIVCMVVGDVFEACFETSSFVKMYAALTREHIF